MVSKQKNDIRELSLEQLEDKISSIGEQKFRARQLSEWLWKKSTRSFDEMTNLPASFREYLDQNFEIRAVSIHTKQVSQDGTMKYAFELYDGNIIEGVLIPTEDRVTACVSSQVGCSLSCAFCATGFLPRSRNLTGAEIYDQYVLLNEEAQKQYGRPISNVVFMGMGEPLLNYKNVLFGIDRLTNEDSLNISPKRITVSTAGIAKMIKQLGKDGVKFNLALSLHATTDEARNKIMAINESNHLDTLVEALNEFYEQTGSKITFEYILFNQENDSPEDAYRLIQLARKVPGAKINLLNYNPIEQANFTRAKKERRERFVSILEQAGVTVTVRKSRGKDIDAACGQLANKQ